MYIELMKIRGEIHNLFKIYLNKNYEEHLLESIEEILIQDSFEESFENLIKNNMYKSQEILDLLSGCFKVITHNFSDLKDIKDLGNYTYQYSLFPFIC